MVNRKSEKRQRTKLVGIRFTPDEHLRLSYHAADQGTTIAGFLRELVADYEHETGQTDIEVINADVTKGPLAVRSRPALLS